MNSTQRILIISIIGLFFTPTFFSPASASFPYYGTKIGSLTRLHHGVSGDVYAVDSRTIFLKNFNYDGEAPAAYFYVGNSAKPQNAGASRLRDERGGTTSLTRRYRNKDITLSLPEGKTLRDFKWFSVWCDEFAVNFGDVTIPSDLDYPRPQKIAALKGVHGVASDNIVIVDAQTLLVPNFSYDGEAPDAKFWVGRGQRPTPQGLRIPDENGKELALRRYDRKTIVLTLPADLTIFDIGHFGVWCEAFTVDFGHVRVPEGLNVPPSLKMLGISPQSKLNCEVLYDDLAFEVRWAVAGESIVIQLVAKLADNEYMSFGISPSKDRSVMIGSDVVVAWVEKDTGKGYAQDYYLDDKSQCSGGRGTCPDVNIQDNTNSIRLLNAAMVNGYSIVTYQRSLQATDRLDLPISINGTEAIVWAIGPLNERKEASFHSQFPKRTHFVEFGRQPTWNCPMPEGTKTPDESEEAEEEETRVRDTLTEGYPPARSSSSSTTTTRRTELEEEFYDNRAQALQSPNRRQESRPAEQELQRPRPVPTPKPANKNDAWEIPAIQCYEPEDGVFYAQMGPTGGKHGYPAITGHVGWGISWYINGLLIPEIHVVRGKTYTFVVEGGINADVPAKYHPFYITDDPIGGYEHKREEEKKAVRIFAGVHRSRSGQVTPTGVGRLCNWTPDIDGPPADDYQSFGAYQRTLTLKCDPGEPGVITWTPDRSTPDTVYYQCFTHRYLGWKIHVHDSCDDARYSASQKHEVRVPYAAEEDLRADASIRHETKQVRKKLRAVREEDKTLFNHSVKVPTQYKRVAAVLKAALERKKSKNSHIRRETCGHVGWGISWYINGLLIPEIHVVRGKTYTFVVEGGINADVPAKYHPFYITDDPIGGYEHKREEEKKAVRIFAGVHRSRSGQVTPTGVGRLCNWTPDIDGPPADDYQSFGAYQRTLTLKCDPGEPGVITWTPDRSTPDTVYYQCFTHRYLGWKIHVHDSCDDARYSASQKHEVRVPYAAEEDLRADASIRHETKRMRGMQAVLKQYIDNRGAIDNAIEQTKILEENPRLCPALCKILVTELIFGRKQLNGESKPVATVRDYRERLLEALGGAAVGESTKKKVAKPRYVRINTNLLSMAEALEMLAAEEWRKKEHAPFESYSDFLAAVSNLEEDEFMVDMHVDDLLIFHAKQKHYWACHEYVKTKKFMLQDKGTCLVAELLQPAPGAVVLDMCAAPGMKTIHVCNVMKNKGTIYAVEQSADRYRLLCNMTEEAGCEIVKPINADALTIDNERCPEVEYVLVDPSCSGSGMQNRMSLDPDEKDPARLKKLAGLQIKMLSHAMSAFPGANRIVYSTCSLYEEENEQVVQRCLELNPQFRLLSGKKALRNKWKNLGNSEYKKIGKFCLYAKPDVDHTDGIFIAIFERRGEEME